MTSQVVICYSRGDCSGGSMNQNEETINISDFKARCLQLLQATGEKGTGYTITKKGVPLARVIPVTKKSRKPIRGSLKGLIKTDDDVVHWDWSSEFEACQP